MVSLSNPSIVSVGMRVWGVWRYLVLFCHAIQGHSDGDQKLIATDHGLEFQSTLIETWESDSFGLFIPTSGHSIVIQMKQSESLTDSPVGERIWIKTETRDIDILTQQGDHLIRQRLVSGVPRSFILNQAGRFSFTIPVHDQPKMSREMIFLPALMVKLDRVHDDHW